MGGAGCSPASRGEKGRSQEQGRIREGACEGPGGKRRAGSRDGEPEEGPMTDLPQAFLAVGRILFCFTKEKGEKKIRKKSFVVRDAAAAQEHSDAQKPLPHWSGVLWKAS